jgi:hypothetical protein
MDMGLFVGGTDWIEEMMAGEIRTLASGGSLRGTIYYGRDGSKEVSAD